MDAITTGISLCSAWFTRATKSNRGGLTAHSEHLQRSGRSGLLEEKRGAVSAYVSCFPGQQYNVRKLWLRGDHKANLSFVYSPFLGYPWSEDLQDEYTLAFETRQGTPFFFTPFGERSGNGNTTVLAGSEPRQEPER